MTSFIGPPNQKSWLRQCLQCMLPVAVRLSHLINITYIHTYVLRLCATYTSGLVDDVIRDAIKAYSVDARHKSIDGIMAARFYSVDNVLKLTHHCHQGQHRTGGGGIWFYDTIRYEMLF